MIIGKILALLVLLATLPVGLQAQLTPAQAAAVEQVASTRMSERFIPGLSVAIVIGDGPVWTGAWGFADLENFVPVTPHSSFRLGSISKPITAVAAMLLVEQGRLDLDAPVQTYVPGFPVKQWPVTTRLLLSHQAGIRHYRKDYSDFNSTRHFWSVTEALEMFAGDPLEFEPGTAFLYSSFGFNLAGAVIGRVAGMPYDQFVRESVLVPVGALSTQPDDVYRLVPHRVRGYRLRSSGILENCALADTSNKIPGGGWLSTARDLVLFSRGLMNGKLLSPASVDQMWSERKTRSGESTGYGLGWRPAKRGKMRVVAHGGSQQGADTYLLLAPEQKIAIAVLANLESANTASIADAILKALSESAQ